MGTLIDTADRGQIESLAMHGSSAAIRRRAQLLLLYDQGLPTREVAEQVDLSASRTRYWRRRFIFEGMAIFAETPLVTDPAPTSLPPDDGSDMQPLPEPYAMDGESPAEEHQEHFAESPPSAAEVSPQPLGESTASSAEGVPISEQEAGNEPVSLDELRQRYPANLRQAEHRRDLTLEIFDATQSTHQLPDGQRRLLEVAALLQYLTENQDDPSSTKSGYLFILSHPLTDLNEAENKIVESVLASLPGKIADSSLAAESDQIPQPSDREAQTLAAMLRIAHGLDASQTQETMIDSIEMDSRGLSILVRGPQAKLDARKAKKAAKLWSRLFEQKVRFQVVYQLGKDGDKRLEALLARNKPGVKPDDSLSGAGRKVMGYHFAQMVLHEAGTRLGEDIEELHDMRVATRRMRAAFEVFQDAFDAKAVKTHLKGLRATGRALGRVRDLDVFMEKAQQYLDTLPQEQRSGLEPLLALWENERQFDREKMLEHLNSENYADFKRKFLDLVSTPGVGAKPVPETSPNLVQHVAPVLIYTRLASVRAYGPLLGSATIEQLHSLRIEFKKLRYTLEFFREVLGEETKALIEEVKILQDHLGDLNDADVACSILREFLDEWESRQLYKPISERENPEPVVAYLANKHAERYFLTITFQDVWGEFDQPEMRAKLASSVAVL
jgi:CHAD domain-containing protein